MLTPVRLNVSSNIWLSRSVSPPSPSLRFSRKKRCWNTHFWSFVHWLIHCLSSGSAECAKSIPSGAIKPSRDEATSKNNLFFTTSLLPVLFSGYYLIQLSFHQPPLYQLFTTQKIGYP